MTPLPPATKKRKRLSPFALWLLGLGLFLLLGLGLLALGLGQDHGPGPLDFQPFSFSQRV